MQQSFYVMHRGWTENPALDDEPFCRRAAWAWIVQEASYRPRSKLVAGNVVTLCRGEFAHSIRFMGEAWGWHRSKVERFLARLKAETMIKTRIEVGVTVISVCNYAKYQDVPRPHENAFETPCETNEKEKKVSKKEIPSESLVHPACENSEVEAMAKKRGDVASDKQPDMLAEASPNRPSNVVNLPGDDCAAAVNAWNETAKRLGLPLVHMLSEARRGKLKARLSDAGGIAGWMAALEEVSASSFLQGKVGNRPWKASFDFLVQQSSFLKVIEGNYRDADTGPVKSAGVQRQEDSHARMRKMLADMAGIDIAIDAKRIA